MRLDQYLLSHAFVKTRSQATDLIKRGLVFVDGVVVTKAGYEIVSQDVELHHENQFVSRAGEKLLQALLDFKIDLKDKRVVDIGSSTGGFTDCALQQGAKEVYAYDVGKNQMDITLRNRESVHLFEGTNILDVTLP
ncbi:MAG: TlyA family rRNA (cytidine-2'-O)-methyltransferase, partial [Acholeplasmataceae bacterium]|nr:TlyA family rRNA (cytidine-2'-O)-methyltransferase [Acholeplasmataceae bacterium]